VARQSAGSANTTAGSKGAEDLPRRCQVREDGTRRLPPSPPATTSRRDPAGSVTIGEKRERETKRVDTAVLFRSGEGERVRRREQP
jgi:hypothetical protein